VWNVFSPKQEIDEYKIELESRIEKLEKENEFLKEITKNKRIYFKSLKEENKKYLYIALGIISICLIYQVFFRYEYKIYEGKYGGYVLKLDRLTGKATQEYAKKR
jgi:hypothetical protein